MHGLEPECTEGFLSQQRTKRQLRSSCCISCSVGAGDCIDSGIKRTFRVLEDVVQKKPKASALVHACWLCLAVLGNGCCQPITCPCGVTAAWGWVIEGKRQPKKKAPPPKKSLIAPRSGDGLAGATKASIDCTEDLGLAVSAHYNHRIIKVGKDL